MPSILRTSHPISNLRTSTSSNDSAISNSSAVAGLTSNLISVGSIALHDNLRCDILRSPISILGSRSLSPGQPLFAVSRLSLIIKFVPVELDASDTKLRATVTPPTRGRLEYVDARVELADSREPADSDIFNEPLHLADALSGDKHYERIIKAGTALTTGLRKANQTREDFPKLRPTGGFIVKADSPPVVGQLGSQWLDPPEAERVQQSRSGILQTVKRHARSASAASHASTNSPSAEGREGTATCSGSHWECEPCGSGTGEIIFCLRPALRCPLCSLRPLKLIHDAAPKSDTPSPEDASAFIQALPNKTLKLVTHLLNMDDGQVPEEFFAHFRIAF
jgi:hypothetical protein